MEADPGTGHAWIMIILIAALFLISALLTAAEMAVDQVNRNQIRQSAEDGDKRAETIVKLFERSNELVASALVMQVFCGLMSCLIFVRMMNGDLSSALASRGIPYSGAISDVILVVGIGCLFLVICVLYPRQSAKKEPEKTDPIKEKVAEKKDSVVLDQYEAKDIRVRTGGYRIIGTDRVMTIKEGDNLTRIAKRTLGPGMECYIEVYNDISSKTELKAGQTIKIPKLERKKKKKK